ncbi:MAG: hypothetical protein ACO1QR_11805 [Chthoniobacteraceae bacterium]
MGCKPQITGTWTSSSDVTVNDVTKRKRVKHGVTRRLETRGEIEIKDGAVTKFPKGAVIKLQESGSSEAREAELRESADKLELWIKEKGSFRRGTAEDEAWLKRFLENFASK